jgi:hypothetical protein
MKKILFLLAALPALCFAQKTEIQHVAYGEAGVPYTSIGYDMRFRNTGSMPDFALGTWLHSAYNDQVNASLLGTGIEGNILLGKNTHAFTLGLSSSISLSTRATNYDLLTGYSNYRNALQMIQTRPFIGYRYQPKDKRLYFEIRHNPIRFTTEYNDGYKDGYLARITTPYNNSNQSFFWSGFSFRLGFNLNLLKDSTAAAPAAYEAPTSPKIELQHAFAIGFWDIMYDLRWRRADKTDFALNLAYTPFDGGGLNYNYSAQALGILFEGNANMELGLMWEYRHLELIPLGRPTYQSSTNLSFIGIPIGFRLQPRKGFFARCYAAPYKYISLENLPSNSPQLSEYKTGLDGIRLGIGLGYTF